MKFIWKFFSWLQNATWLLMFWLLHVVFIVLDYFLFHRYALLLFFSFFLHCFNQFCSYFSWSLSLRRDIFHMCWSFLTYSLPLSLFCTPRDELTSIKSNPFFLLPSSQYTEKWMLCSLLRNEFVGKHYCYHYTDANFMSSFCVCNFHDERKFSKCWRSFSSSSNFCTKLSDARKWRRTMIIPIYA